MTKDQLENLCSGCLDGFREAIAEDWPEEASNIGIVVILAHPVGASMHTNLVPDSARLVLRRVAEGAERQEPTEIDRGGTGEESH
jgi:hypothetical protein